MEAINEISVALQEQLNEGGWEHVTYLNSLTSIQISIYGNATVHIVEDGDSMVIDVNTVDKGDTSFTFSLQTDTDEVVDILLGAIFN